MNSSPAATSPEVDFNSQDQNPAALGTAPLVRPHELTFTIVSASDARPLAKKFWLDASGELQDETVATLVWGKATVEHAASITGFAERLDALETHEAVLYGLPPLTHASVVTEKQFSRMSPEQRRRVITRTRAYVQFAQAPGIAMVDVDTAGAPSELLAAVASPERTRELLVRAIPQLAAAPMLWRPSSSSYLYQGEQEIHGLRGQRIYIAVARASDIPDLGAFIYERLWLLGYGYFSVSASGQLLDRTLVDRAVWQPERLDFAAGPILTPPLERRVSEPRLWNSEAAFFDATRIPPLSPQDQRLIQALRRNAKAAVRETARARRKLWVAERVAQWAARASNLDVLEATAIAEEAAERQVLRPGFTLLTEDGDAVDVGQLLDNPEAWHERRFHDPLEPDYRNDGRIAWANMRPTRGRPYIYSHAHGGIRYELTDKRQTIFVAPGELTRVVDQSTEILVAEGQVYQYEDQISRVTDAGRLTPVEPEWLTDWLQRHADVMRNGGNGWEPADLAPKYAKTVLAKAGEIALPPLVAITNGPFLRSDGSVVDQPGYDPAMQVLYHPISPGAPAVRRVVTNGEAEEALRFLWAPFREFPFQDDVDRGTVLALLFTAVVRPSISIAPGGLIESHEAGSGKTLLARSIASLTGIPAVPQAFPQSQYYATT